MRPENTAELTEKQISELVTRDSMIGTGLPLNREQLDDAQQANNQLLS
jgi:hypothetical protein